MNLLDFSYTVILAPPLVAVVKRKASRSVSYYAVGATVSRADMQPEQEDMPPRWSPSKLCRPCPFIIRAREINTTKSTLVCD